MKDSQPAWQLTDRDESANVAALERLLKRAPQPKRLLEFFGGVGGCTRLLQRIYPGVEIESWDTDDRCYETLRAIEGVRAVKGDSLEECTPRDGDGVVMDFNLWTLIRAGHNYYRAMSRVFACSPAWVTVADSSLSKMHINYQSYGLSSPSWEEYAKKVDSWIRGFDYQLLGWERAHHKVHMLLFTPIDSANEKTPLVRRG